MNEFAVFYPVNLVDASHRFTWFAYKYKIQKKGEKSGRRHELDSYFLLVHKHMEKSKKKKNYTNTKLKQTNCIHIVFIDHAIP